jgi:hypothetical protein
MFNHLLLSTPACCRSNGQLSHSFSFYTGLLPKQWSIVPSLVRFNRIHWQQQWSVQLVEQFSRHDLLFCLPWLIICLPTKYYSVVLAEALICEWNRAMTASR